MRIKISFILLISISFLLATIVLLSCNSKPEKKTQESNDYKVELVKNESEKKVDIIVDGKLFTTFQWPDGVYKPILYPILTSSGTSITRGFPLNPKQGERPDHIHQVGNWLNYGNVNGSDFWGNGYSGERSQNGGEIKHLSIENISSGNGEGSLITKGAWLDSLGHELLTEKTEYHFIAKNSIRIIDRITTLTALGSEVFLPDTKEGMFAIRVVRELELPSEGKITLLNENGNQIKLETTPNEGITGNYISSEGITGLEVWGTRAKWMNLYGKIRDEKISIVICDHPKNINYPTYWHARGYGLFSANPLGVKDFTKGAETFNLSIPTGESVVFRYRIVISSNNFFTNSEIDAFAGEFSEKYN